MVYEFTSVGPKGQIKKLVKYSETNLKDLYNLAFGDKDLITGEINDKTISNNGDSDMVLATVVATVYAFTDKYRDAWVFATGSTKARTRLYRMGITKYLLEIKHDFQVFGLKDEEWEKFEKDIEYEAFLVQRKQYYIYSMNIKELNSKKTTLVTIDKSLEKFKKQPLFQEKVDKANEILRKVGLPKNKKHYS